MLVFDIKRYAIHDGPGIRITIFMKGCPLACVWCHNPEGLSDRKEKLYTGKRCIGCGTCIAACPQQALVLTGGGVITDPIRCNVCGRCAEVCPTLAMEISGIEYTADQLMEEIEKETVFMDRSEGGVTFCGGEPLLQPDALEELLKRCGALGIHRVVDTSLLASPEVIRRVRDHTELFLVDLKLMDAVRHRLFCGVSNERILSNLRLLAEGGSDFYIRIPLIEGVNADDENILQSAAFLSTLPGPRKTVYLLPYHAIGKGKHEKRGTVYNPRSYPMSAPSEEKIRHCQALFRQYGLDAVVGG